MTVTVDRSQLDQLRIDLSRIFPIEPRAGAKAALLIQQRIKERTASGIDVNENQFAPYSESYGQQRLKIGLSADKPDLFRSGHMLGATDAVITDDSITLGFLPGLDLHGQDAGRKALKHMTGQGVPVRRFFAINDKDIDRVIEILVEPFDKL